MEDQEFPQPRFPHPPPGPVNPRAGTSRGTKRGAETEEDDNNESGKRNQHSR
jgi:hypothetical protein